MFEGFNEVLKNEDLAHKYLLAEIAGGFYAFSISAFQEVIPMTEIFPVDASSKILGVINFRGVSVPVVDLKVVLNKTTIQDLSKQKLLVLSFRKDKIALVVDTLHDIVSLNEATFVRISNDGDFLSTTIYEEKNVSVIDISMFFNMFFMANSSLRINAENDEIEIENALLPTKERNDLLQLADNYFLTSEALLKEKFIIFRLNDEVYAFNISYIEEIKKISRDMVCQIPCVPPFVRGIINAKGDYLSLMDIKPFLNMKLDLLVDKMDVLIINVNEVKFAILVDEIIDIEKLTIKTLAPVNNVKETFIKGEITYREFLVNLLDVDKLFSMQNLDLKNYELE